MEECCSICADVLEYCAFGPCGHNSVCSKCTARLRQLQGSRECVFCKAPWKVVFVTKYMDEHTRRLSPEAFTKLQEKGGAPGLGQVWHLRSIDAYFDDEAHFKAIERSCGLNHPALSAVTSSQLTIRNLEELKRIIKTKLSMYFCPLCLENRQVFISEQQLYTKASLDEHNKKGDSEGALAETNFKGHPMCNFCKVRFYDDQKLFMHMEQEHYQCHICRRRNPEKHKYYRAYDELQKHFDTEHHACPYPSCLEAKFVVFAEEYELKRHIAQEHKDEVRMTNAERRQASRVPGAFHYASGAAQNGVDNPEAVQEVRVGIIIGGGGAGGRATVRPNARARERDTIAAAEQAAAMPQPVTQPTAPLPLHTDEHFPGLAPSTSAAMLGGTATGRWAGNAGGRAAARGVNSGSFPALGAPLSKGAKKKLREKAKREATAGFGSIDDMPPAHVMALTETPADPQPSAGPSTQPHRPQRPQMPLVPDNVASSSSQAPPHDPQAWTKSRATAKAQAKTNQAQSDSRNAAASSTSGSSALSSNTFSVLENEVPTQAKNNGAQSSQQQRTADDFPTLQGQTKASAQTAARADAATSRGNTLRPFAAAATQTSPAKPAPSRAAAVANFPALGGSAAMHSARAAASPSLWGAAVQSRPAAAAAAPPPERQPELRSAADFPSLASKKKQAAQGAQSSVQNGTKAQAREGGISEELRIANEALQMRIQAKLSQDEYQQFKSSVNSFMQGNLTASDLHGICVSLGLATEVPQMMALCPVESLRDGMMAVHTEYLEHSTLGDENKGSNGEGMGGWVPPEALAAATTAAQYGSSWVCKICTLVNAPAAESCSACDTPKAVSIALQAEDAAGKKGKKRGQKVPLHQLHTVHPQNVWTQRRP